MAQLPDLHVSDSSEAMLSGRKPPFRLLVRAVHDEGRRLSIRHAVSEGFVVPLAASPPALGPHHLECSCGIADSRERLCIGTSCRCRLGTCHPVGLRLTESNFLF